MPQAPLAPPPTAAGPPAPNSRPATWQDIADAEAKKQGVDPRLVHAMGSVESSFNPSAVSPKGARGIMQLMPQTAQRLGVNIDDPADNIRGGVTEIKRLLTEHQGDVVMALRRYNGSPDAPAEATDPYVQSVLGRLQQRQGGPGQAGASPLPQAQGAQRPQGPKLTPAHGAPPPPPSESWGQWGIRKGKDLLHDFDPREPTGRRNLAGAAGAAAATAGLVATAPVSAPVGGLALAAGGVLGAAGGGMVAEAGEQLAGTKPPSSSAVGLAGAQQGAYELGGQGTVWALKAGGRRLVASGVGKKASEALHWKRQLTVSQLEDALVSGEQAKATHLRSSQSAQDAALPGSPPPAKAGRAAQAVVEGPATATRNQFGQAVEQTAREGPDVDIRKLKASAQAVLDKIAPPQQSFPPTSALAAAQADATRDTLKHPALGVVDRILNAEDTVPFYDAHLWKSELQNSLQGTYDKATKKQVTSITQHLAGELRQSLSGHAPYNQATAQYAKIIPLYTKEYAAQLKKTALTDPEALVRTINPEKPTAAGMLRDLLVEMPKQNADDATGAGAAQGQEAWDLVRSAWTKSKILQGGVDRLGDRLDKLPPAFVEAFYGDASGREVYQNLRTLADAFALEQARHTTEQAGLTETLRLARRPTAEEIKFGQSSLAGKNTSIEQVAVDVGQAAMRGPTSRYGGLAVLRLLKGPKEADLLEWAAYSTPRTQLLVKALTGAGPSAPALSALVRASGILEPQHKVGGPPSGPPPTPPPSRDR